MDNCKKIGPGNPDGLTKVQVGCGPNNLMNDWWNVDLRNFKGIDQNFDATQPWPFSHCLNYIYAEHFLEHLSFDQAIKFLDHARTALTDGGRLRISTPSLEWVLKTHFTFETRQQKVIDQTWAINRAFHGWGHQFLYSREMLCQLISSRSYSNVEFFEYGKSSDEALRNLECHGGYQVVDGFPSVWIVEASVSTTKPEDDTFITESVAKFSRYVAAGH